MRVGGDGCDWGRRGQSVLWTSSWSPSSTGYGFSRPPLLFLQHCDQNVCGEKFQKADTQSKDKSNRMFDDQCSSPRILLTDLIVSLQQARLQLLHLFRVGRMLPIVWRRRRQLCSRRRRRMFRAGLTFEKSLTLQRIVRGSIALYTTIVGYSNSKFKSET